MGGALIGGRAAKLHIGRPECRWLTTAAGIETALLWIAAVLAIGYGRTQSRWRAAVRDHRADRRGDGLRNATIRQMKVADLTTTVLTLTLTGLAADSSVAGGGNPNWVQRMGAAVALFAGAGIGAALLLNVGLAAPLALALAGALVLFGTLVCTAHPAANGVVTG